MLYKEYGKTRKKVSIVGFGGMRFKKINDVNYCVEMMVEAAKAGINYFDTAPKYFGIKSEQVFGEGFRELRRLGLPFYSSTKTDKSTEKDIRNDIKQQLNRMGLDYIDFYHIWCVSNLDDWRSRKKNGVIETLLKLKEEGLIKHICVSTHLIGDEIRELLMENVFEGVTFGYSAYNFLFRQKAFEAISERNIGCMIMNPLGGGVIPRNPDLFSFIKTRKDETVVEAALRFLFAHKHITSALVGFGEKEEIKEAVNAVDGYKEISQEDLDRIKKSNKESFNELCTGCFYCNYCPQDIPIAKLMEAYNYKKLYGTDFDVLERLKWHWGIPPSAAERCTECSQCESACTQHLPIINCLKEIGKMKY